LSGEDGNKGRTEVTRRRRERVCWARVILRSWKEGGKSRLMDVGEKAVVGASWYLMGALVCLFPEYAFSGIQQQRQGRQNRPLRGNHGLSTPMKVRRRWTKDNERAPETCTSCDLSFSSRAAKVAFRDFKQYSMAGVTAATDNAGRCQRKCSCRDGSAAEVCVLGLSLNLKLENRSREWPFKSSSLLKCQACTPWFFDLPYWSQPHVW
jgi:hypothetical protein